MLANELDIHPTHKKPVGERLALAARALAYHEPIEYSGPTYKQMKVKENAVILTFDHLGVSTGSARWRFDRLCHLLKARTRNSSGLYDIKGERQGRGP